MRDFLDRIRTRAESKRKLVDFVKKGICYGSLTAAVNVPIGTSISEIAAAQIASENQIGNSYNLSLMGTTGATITSAASFQWDAGFLPQTIRSANGAAEFISQNLNVVAGNKPYAVSCQLSVDTDFALANPSTACRVAVTWTGGVGRTDSVDINPATGAIISASAGVTNVSSQQIQTLVGTLGSTHIGVTIYSVSFITPNTDPAVGTGTFKFFPNINAGVGQCVLGAVQVEQSTVASAFMSTVTTTSANKRIIGTIPRLNIDTTIRDIGDGGNFTYVSPFHNRCTVFTGGTVTLPAAASTIPPQDGETIFLFNAPNGSGLASTTVNVPAGSQIAGLNLNWGAILTSITFPWDGATPSAANGGASLSNVTALQLTYVKATNQWRITGAATRGDGASPVSPSPVSASLGADVVMGSSTYFDGPSVNVGNTGTWFVTATVSTTAIGGELVLAKLWDGATIINSCSYTTVSAQNSITVLSGFITNPAGPLKISLKPATTGTMVSNGSGNGKDSTITAFRIA